MKNVVVITHPRSSSTFFMKQFLNSKLFLCDKDVHYELISPWFRNTTRTYLGLPTISNMSKNPYWDDDKKFVETFIQQHLDTGVAFKCLTHNHSYGFFEYLNTNDDIIKITMNRKDKASQIASLLVKLSTVAPGSNSFLYPAKQDNITFSIVRTKVQADKIMSSLDKDGKLNRFIESLYWGSCVKHERIQSLIDSDYHYDIEDFHTSWGDQSLEKELNFKFDFSKYLTPSHYSEIFSDWKDYEKFLRDALGPIDGL